MTDINHVVIVGRLTRDAETRYTTGGTCTAKVSIATNRSVKKNDAWQDEASFFDVTLWGKMAEGLSKYLTKGQQIAVDGELRQERWEKDGQKNSKVVIVANSVQLLGGKREGVPASAPNVPQSDEQPFEDDIPF